MKRLAEQSNHICDRCAVFNAASTPMTDGMAREAAQGVDVPQKGVHIFLTDFVKNVRFIELEI